MKTKKQIFLMFVVVFSLFTVNVVTNVTNLLISLKITDQKTSQIRIHHNYYKTIRQHSDR